jgi:hypothetical protein
MRQMIRPMPRQFLLMDDDDDHDHDDDDDDMLMMTKYDIIQ